MAPAVPTGMKAGVRIAPWGVISLPVRAAPSVANNSKWLGSLMRQLMTRHGCFVQPSLGAFSALNPLTAAFVSRICPRHDHRDQNHPENQSALWGLRRRARVVERSHQLN